MAEAGAGELRLEIQDYVDPARWRWVLTGSGEVLAAHEVRLDSGAWQYEAFNDLLGYLSWHAPPGRRAKEEARIVNEVGAWIGAQILGPIAAVLAAAAPATIRVTVPGEAQVLAYRPLELAHAGGVALAAQGLTLVMDQGPETAGKTPAGDRLRILGLFSLPEGSHALNLRHERYNLVRLIERIEAGGKGAHVRVLFGVAATTVRGLLLYRAVAVSLARELTSEKDGSRRLLLDRHLRRAQANATRAEPYVQWLLALGHVWDLQLDLRRSRWSTLGGGVLVVAGAVLFFLATANNAPTYVPVLTPAVTATPTAVHTP